MSRMMQFPELVRRNERTERDYLAPHEETPACWESHCVEVKP